MELFILISAVAFFASMLTFFSGFGLGTILTPFFAIFFPVEQAIALTAIVHFLNNIFKLILTGKNIQFQILIRFGVPAIIGSLAGAWILLFLPEIKPLGHYLLGGKIHEITIINIVVAMLLICFSLFEIIPRLSKISFGKNGMMPGGMLSGFFGGLSGHQGALRSMFLIKLGLSKESFIATGIAIAILVDVARLSVYISNYNDMNFSAHFPLLATAVLSAFTGAYLGNKLLKKITLRFLQVFVSVAIILLAIALGAGLL